MLLPNGVNYFRPSSTTHWRHVRLAARTRLPSRRLPALSLARGHALQEQIQLVQAELKLDKRRTDLSEEIKTLQAAVEFEKQARHNWVVRCGQIDVEMKALRAGPLKGVQINRTHTITDQTDNMIPGETIILSRSLFFFLCSPDTELGSPLQVPDMSE